MDPVENNDAVIPIFFERLSFLVRGVFDVNFGHAVGRTSLGNVYPRPTIEPKIPLEKTKGGRLERS